MTGKLTPVIDDEATAGGDGEDEGDEDHDESSEPSSRAEFGQFGWRLHQGAESDGVDARLVSLHELHHDRLQVTTAHGFLTHVLAALTRNQPDPGWETLLAGVQAASRRTHEQFATWNSAAMLGLDRAQLASQLPGYVGYYDQVEMLLAGSGTIYLRSHLVTALHRAAMQTDILEHIAARGIDRFALSDLSRDRRPDFRYRVLTQVFSPEKVWAFALTALVLWGGDARWKQLQGGSLREVAFGRELDDVWNDLSRRAYLAVRQALLDADLLTLGYDGHTDHTAVVLQQARDLVGGRLGVSLMHESPHRADADIAVFSMEGEQLAIRDAPLPAEVVDGGLEEMVAGEEPYEHIYISVRRRDRVLEQWQLRPGDQLPDDDVIVLARRTVLTDAGRVVELNPLSLHEDLASCPAPAFGDVSMAALGEGGAAAAWAERLGPESSVILLDLQPSHHLQLWLAKPDARLRYAVLNAERSGRTTMVFVVQVVEGEGRSRLFVSPASDLFVRSIRAWLADRGLADRAELDLSLIGENDRVLQISLGHLLGEEFVFDFLAGRDRPE